MHGDSGGMRSCGTAAWSFEVPWVRRIEFGDATRAKRFGMHIPVDAGLPAILVISHGFYVAHMQR